MRILAIDPKTCANLTTYDITSIRDAEQNMHRILCVTIGCTQNCVREFVEMGLPFYDLDGQKLKRIKTKGKP